MRASAVAALLMPPLVASPDMTSGTTLEHTICEEGVLMCDISASVREQRANFPFGSIVSLWPFGKSQAMLRSFSPPCTCSCTRHERSYPFHPFHRDASEPNALWPRGHQHRRR